MTRGTKIHAKDLRKSVNTRRSPFRHLVALVEASEAVWNVGFGELRTLEFACREKQGTCVTALNIDLRLR